MIKETLSAYILPECFVPKDGDLLIRVNRVREFIKKLKGKLFEEAIERKKPLTDSSLDSLPCNWVNRVIDDIAGEELLGTPNNKKTSKGGSNHSPQENSSLNSHSKKSVKFHPEDKPLKKDNCANCGHKEQEHKRGYKRNDKRRMCLVPNCKCKKFKPLKKGCGKNFLLDYKCGEDKWDNGEPMLCQVCSGDEK